MFALHDSTTSTHHPPRREIVTAPGSFSLLAKLSPSYVDAYWTTIPSCTSFGGRVFSLQHSHFLDKNHG